jgi:Cu+-exporting ATPase
MRVRDPVCSKEMDMADVVASEDYDGWAYFFCSDHCHSLFVKSPERFTQRPTSSHATAAATKSTE